MMFLPIGSYVTHAKLLELGSGQIVASDGQRVSIRFASGERSFVYELVQQHLNVTAEAPPPARPAKQPRKPRVPK